MKMPVSCHTELTRQPRIDPITDRSLGPKQVFCTGGESQPTSTTRFAPSRVCAAVRKPERHISPNSSQIADHDFGKRLCDRSGAIAASGSASTLLTKDIGPLLLGSELLSGKVGEHATLDLRQHVPDQTVGPGALAITAVADHP